MRWKYIKWAVLIIVVLLMLIPAYQYFGSIDWSKKHSGRIAELPLLQQTDDTGEFRLQIGDLEFLVRVAGMQNDGEEVILLHGFPESSIMWNALLKKASNEGYRVLAFNQRGYSPGARPTDTKAYQISNLTD
ncbi:MAG: alpha/beta fold hydrolase, partial [Aurantibacter sp.]